MNFPELFSLFLTKLLCDLLISSLISEMHISKIIIEPAQIDKVVVIFFICEV